MTEALLRRVVDLTWAHAFENESVQSSEVATRIIDAARASFVADAKFAFVEAGHPLPDYIIERIRPGDRVLVEAIVRTGFNGAVCTNWPIRIELDTGESDTVDIKGNVHRSALRAVVERAKP